MFTEELARRCEARGAQFLFGRDIERLQAEGGAVRGVRVRDRATGGALTMQADAVVVACGSYTAGLLRGVGVHLPIYPGKGYSATFKLKKPEAAPLVSSIDDVSDTRPFKSHMTAAEYDYFAGNWGGSLFNPGQDNPAALAYGQSITDACIGWDDSEGVLQVLSDAVKARRNK